MIRLPKATDAWNSPAFQDTLKRELEALAPGQLPLQQGLSVSSHALDEKIEVMVIGAADEPERIRARVGIFYSGLIAGCSCADDPTPVQAQSEYCELAVAIDKATAEATVTLAPDQDPTRD